jgi:DNA invertase Pin-like site-specific DNA recombinase
MTAAKYVGYLRVSTDRQGESGLGLEAQRAAIVRHINGNAEVLSWYTETETGKRNDRPELAEALDHCELTGATLVVATLDRLTRDRMFLEMVKRRSRAGFEFKCADMPDASAFVLGIMADVAEYELAKISQRTKAALAAAKARGVKLGNPRGAAPMAAGRAEGAIRAGERHRAKADSWAEKRRAAVNELVAGGIGSNNAIARELNGRMILTPRNGLWTATSVRRLRERLGI